jgi:hypothetical protein
MKYATVEDVVASFSHPIIPTVQGKPDYRTKLLQANTRAIDTGLGGGDLGHLGIIVYEAAYALCCTDRRKSPAVIEQGTAAQLSAVRHSWEEGVLAFCTFYTVQQAIKKHIITVFEPMYLDILNDDMVGFSNITTRDMPEHLFLTYSITDFGLERNFKQTRKARDPQQPVETLLKQIQDCADFSEAGDVAICHAHQINVGYANIFAKGNFMSACRRWNDKETSDKTCANFKVHFAAAHRQYNQLQGESDASSGYHAANTAVGQTEDEMDEATIGTLAKLAAATAT